MNAATSNKFSLATIRIQVRLCDYLPLRPLIAACASDLVGISTNPNPLDTPLDLSVMILAEVTSPNSVKASRNSSSASSCNRLP